MRSASGPLLAHLNALRSGDAQTLIANLYTFTLRSGTILTYTDADVPIIWNGYTYLADSILIGGLRFKCSTGLEVDQQQITISARETDTVQGVPFLQALRLGNFDGCHIQRELAFLPAWDEAPTGAVILFKGRMGTVDKIGRISSEITVNSDMILLDIDMPRNVYTPNCQHVLYDSGCGLVKNAFGANGSVEAGSGKVFINWSGGSDIYNQGTITFTSGVNNGVTANVKHGYAGGLRMSYPLLSAPGTGDTFTVYQGCDHTKATCLSKFSNLGNFRGFPYVPQPQNAV